MLSFKKNQGDQSPGEVLFDRSVYTGIGFGANEILSLIIAVEGRHYGGKKLYDGATKKFATSINKVNKLVGRKPVVHNEAGDILEVGTLLIGGTLLVVPMKWLEDRKASIVQKLNHGLDKLHGNKLDDEALKIRDKEVAEDIACEPKQTWGSLITGRVLAVLSNMVILKNTVLRGDKTNWAKDKTLEVTTVTTETLNNKLHSGKENTLLGKWSKSGRQVLADTHNKVENSKHHTRFTRYTEVAGIETFYTLASSIVLEIASKFIASKKPKVKNPELYNESKLAEQGQEKKKKKCDVVKEKTNTKFADKVSQSRKTLEPSTSYAESLALEADQQLQPGV